MNFSFLRAPTLSVLQLLTYPMTASIEKVFEKNGLNLGAWLLTFIFVNCIWFVFLLEGALWPLRTWLFPQSAGNEPLLMSSVLLVLGNYFYFFPLAACLLFPYAWLSRAEEAGRRSRFGLYHLAVYLCTTAIITNWVFTFFSYHLLLACKQFPATGSAVIYEPQNLYAYFSFFFPWLNPQVNWQSPSLYFALYGACVGILGGLKHAQKNFFTAKTRDNQSAQHVLFEALDSNEKSYFRFLFLLYLGFIVFFIFVPVWMKPQFRPQLPYRTGLALILGIPLYFMAGVFLFRRFRRRGSVPPDDPAGGG